jgi:hypothetical protein
MPSRFVDPRIILFHRLVLGHVDLVQVTDPVIFKHVSDFRFLKREKKMI